MGEKENEVKRRKAEARSLAQNENMQKMLDEMVSRQNTEPFNPDKKYEGGRSLNEFLKGNPRNKTLEIVCTDPSHFIPQTKIARQFLSTLNISYVIGQPGLPKIVALGSVMKDFGLIYEPLIHGKKILSLDYDARDKAEERGYLTWKTSLKCTCTREVRFKSNEVFLECLKIILNLKLSEASLELFEKILKAKSQRHAQGNS